MTITEACIQLEEAGEGVSAQVKINTKGCSQVARDSEMMQREEEMESAKITHPLQNTEMKRRWKLAKESEMTGDIFRMGWRGKAQTKALELEADRKQ